MTRVDGLKQGKSKVIEQDQTVILGWNDRILPLIDQLCQANESDGGKPIVVLADRDKVGMDEYLMDSLRTEGAHWLSPVVAVALRPLLCSKWPSHTLARLSSSLK